MAKTSRSYAQVVAAAYDTAIQAVRGLREKRRRWVDLLSDIYGPKAKDSTTLDAIDQWIDQTTPIEIKTLKTGIPDGVKAGYINNGPDGKELIGLSENYLEQASVEDLTGVILEELGHAIDTRINGKKDTLGDEGRRFSNRVRGVEKRRKESLDHGNIVIDGHKYKAEFSSGPVLVGPKVTLSAGVVNNRYKIWKEDLAKGYQLIGGTNANWTWVSGLEATNATVADTIGHPL